MELLLRNRPTKFKLPSAYEDPDFLGLGLVLEPYFDFRGEMNQFQLYLLNHSWSDVMSKMEISLDGVAILETSGKIPGMSLISLVPLAKNIMASKPEIKIQINHKNFKTAIEKSIKLQLSHVLNQLTPIPHLQDQLLHFITFFNYTFLEEHVYYQIKENTIDAKFEVELNFKNQLEESKHDVIERANFTGVIDLHFDQKDAKKIPPSILELQLNKLMHFVDRAIYFEKEEVKIIHGKGDGILKNKIYELLRYLPQKHSLYLSTDGGTSILKLKY